MCYVSADFWLSVIVICSFALYDLLLCLLFVSIQDVIMAANGTAR